MKTIIFSGYLKRQSRSSWQFRAIPSFLTTFILVNLALFSSPIPHALAEASSEEEALIEAEAKLLAQLEQEAQATSGTLKVRADENLPAVTARTQLPTPVDSRDSARIEVVSQQGGTEVAPPFPTVSSPEALIEPSDKIGESELEQQARREIEAVRTLTLELQERLERQQTLEKQVEGHLVSIQGLESLKDQLSKRLEVTQLRVAQLLEELEKSQNRLIVAETEVERLSEMVHVRGSTRGPKAGAVRTATVHTGNSKSPSEIPSRTSTPDMTIGTVIVDKANLRTGPGLNNSPLMTVAQGTRLAIETRQGGWYRVIAPTGARAWVSEDVLRFPGSAEEIVTESAVRVRGLSDADEDQAFRLIKNSSSR